jgi:quercetin dioxygenase-like cupin family protein
MAAPDSIIGDASFFADQHKDAFPLYVRMMVFKAAGDQEPEHAHRDGHFTALLKGRALFNVEGRLVEHVAPSLVWIAAGSKHQITALEDDTQTACIHDKRAFE